MELVNVIYNGPGAPSEDLTLKDRNLIISNFINSSFGNSDDYIELYVYGENGNILLSDYDATDYYPFLNNNPKNNTYSAITLDPEKDARNRGFDRGKVTLQYNFYKKLFNSQFGTYYWIKEISNSRTELKLASQVLSDSVIRQGFDDYRAYISSKNYYPVFYLNFGNNITVVANNVAYTEDDNGSYILVKLYEPLPNQYDVKSELWIVDKIAQSVSFDVNIQVDSAEVDDSIKLRGPNYNVQLNTKNGQTTPFYTYDYLANNAITSSYQKLKSYYQDKAVQINVDYSSFSNFVHFSSAVERVNNFVYKLQLIESSSAIISQQKALVGGGSVASSSITTEQLAIDNIIKNFDIYEYYLYFESASWAWPKSTSTQPYQLYSVTSSEASNFIGEVDVLPTATTQSLLWSASYYDSTNKDLLHNSVPQYLLDDPANQPYITFLDMIGQHFDNIWIYYKDITNRFNATNSPNTGISLDLVSEALRGLGIQLYTNSNVSDNLYYTLFGINPDGSLLPPTGSELITNYVTSSLQTLPAQQIQDEIYKRLYHNIPYLYKSKGTPRAIKALISIYGIPDSILTVKEFGGNFTGSLDGILDLDSSEYKITIATGSNGSVTGSQTISSSLLSPYTTIQYYKGDTRLNDTDLQIGFSPADTINSNISTGLSNLNIDQLIGSPALQYSSSYVPLVSASNAYFASYTQPNSVWEYIRLLKFYNNSLFKIIKDFVPARANVSTGIIVKSHMLERNRYTRHEPSVTFNDYSQSIEMLEVSADNGGALTGSTSWSGFITTPIGLASYSSTDGIEKYNGELSGSQITVTDGQSMEQREYSSTITGSYGELVQLGALYQNVSSSVRSQNLIDLDYNSDQIRPVNYGAVTYSLDQIQVNNYQAYTNPNNPFAQVQDYNYFLDRSLIPRYAGSETISATYNTYTAGDESYGKTAAIDKIKYQYAYLVDIYTSSKFMPDRSNAQIKYLIDNDQNVLDLTKTNKNIFEVQNVYRSGESTDIALFEYDELNPYTQQLANNPTVTIYEGGWRYLPILHNVSSSLSYQLFELQNPTKINIEFGTPIPPDSDYLNPDNYIINIEQCDTYVFIGEDAYTSTWSATVTCSLSPAPTVDITLTIKYTTPTNCNLDCGFIEYTKTVTIPANNTSANVGLLASIGPCFGMVSPGTNCYSSTYPCSIYIDSITAGSGGGGGGRGGTNTYTYYTTNVTSSQPCLYLLSQSNEIVFSSEFTHYYVNNSPLIFSSSSDPNWLVSGLDQVVIPFTLSIGDKISFFDSASRLGWNELNEYTVKNVRVSGSTSTVSSSVLLAEVSRPVNLALFSSGSGIPTESITRSPFRSCRYVVWKHVPDETNVMLRYNPKSPELLENGLLMPQYIDPIVRDNSGNVIKALKQQNLI